MTWATAFTFWVDSYVLQEQKPDLSAANSEDPGRPLGITPNGNERVGDRMFHLWHPCCVC